MDFYHMKMVIVLVSLFFNNYCMVTMYERQGLGKSVQLYKKTNKKKQQSEMI